MLHDGSVGRGVMLGAGVVLGADVTVGAGVGLGRGSAIGASGARRKKTAALARAEDAEGGTAG